MSSSSYGYYNGYGHGPRGNYHHGGVAAAGPYGYHGKTLSAPHHGFTGPHPLPHAARAAPAAADKPYYPQPTAHYASARSGFAYGFGHIQ